MGRIAQPVECTALVECPNECATVEMEATDQDGNVFDRLLSDLEYCPACGAPMNRLSHKKREGLLE